MRTLRSLITAIVIFSTIFILLILAVRSYGQGLAHHVLAYKEEDGQGIELMDADRLLSHLLRFDNIDWSQVNQLHWSPDGQQVALAMYQVWSDDAEIYVLSLTDLTARIISRIVSDGRSPAWSPDSHLLAITSRTSDANSEFRVVDVRTGDTLYYLTQSVGREYTPSWSPDGRMIAFGPWNELRIIDVKSGQVVLALTQPFVSGYPRFWRWSPDSRWLIFVALYNYNEDATLSVIDLNNQRVHQLFSPIDHSAPPPIWSPDSRYIAFPNYEVTNLSPNSAEVLHIINITNGEDEIYTQQGSSYNQPTWSSDGQWLAFSDTKNRILYGVNKSYNQLQVLVSAQYQPYRAMGWSPDDQLLAFSGEVSGKTGLFVLDMKNHIISHLADNVTSPIWQP